MGRDDMKGGIRNWRCLAVSPKKHSDGSPVNDRGIVSRIICCLHSKAARDLDAHVFYRTTYDLCSISCTSNLYVHIRSIFAFPLKIMAGLTGFLLLIYAPSAIAQEVSPAISTYVMEGMVGSRQVGFNITVKDHVQFVGGHYYYASALIDIPLSGSNVSGHINLTEPDGGTFKLHLFSIGPPATKPLTFYTSNRLDGTWTKGGVVLPVTLNFGAVYNGYSPSRWYQEVTNEDDTAFEARARLFLHGVITGNRSEAVKASSFPLRVQARHPMIIRGKAELLARWKQIFTPNYVAVLRRAIPHEMFVHNGLAMVANGAVWFDAKGAVALNVVD